MKGNPVSHAKVGDSLRVRIRTENMKGEKLQFVVWEHDMSGRHDKVAYSGAITVPEDGNMDTASFTITQKRYNLGIGLPKFDPDAEQQQYFIEVIPLTTKAKSVKFGISDEAKRMKVDAGKSAAVVKGQPEKKEEKICDCQKYDLIWGGKVSCEFRKKVVEIAKRLGKNPNLLMAGMALETGRTFSPTAGSGTSYVGLIQFGDAAAKSVGTTREELLKMSALQQLDYVEKYLEKKKDQINTLTDFYLSILMPVDVGKGNHPNHVVFDNEYPLAYNKNGKLTDLSKSRHYGYRQNPAFYFEGELHKNIKIKKSNGKSQTFKELYNEKKTWYENGEKNYNGPGKTYIWEIEKSISKFYEEGKRNKANLFDCHKSETKDIKFSEDKGTWNVIVTEKYTGSKCTHIERTPIRNNCRRGKIEVYDHKGNIVLRINDCLLEGVAGEDRMAKNADIPFGVYQINKETPFYFSDSTNIISYGPNPRLVFEPISGKQKRAVGQPLGFMAEDKRGIK